MDKGKNVDQRDHADNCSPAKALPVGQPTVSGDDHESDWEDLDGKMDRTSIISTMSVTDKWRLHRRARRLRSKAQFVG
jgi:hypothetical protein